MKNQKPEKQMEAVVKIEAAILGFLLFVYESKARFSPSAGVYRRSELPIGHPDMAGITPCGSPCYIELKAIGKGKNTSPHQKAFLKNVIERGAFATVIDCPGQLKLRYNQWLIESDKKAYLLSLI